MTDEIRLAKVQRVYRVKQRVRSAAGKIYEYRVWHGYYCEGARERKVYLGRELPEHFKCMVEGRRFSESLGKFLWPGSHHRSDRGDIEVGRISEN